MLHTNKKAGYAYTHKTCCIRIRNPRPRPNLPLQLLLTSLLLLLFFRQLRESVLHGGMLLGIGTLAGIPLLHPSRIAGAARPHAAATP